MRLSDVLAGIDYEEHDCDDFQIDAVCSNFGDIKEDCAYFLIKEPEKKNGSFLFGGITPSVIICEENMLYAVKGIATVTVNDVRKAFAVASSNYFGINYAELKIIGVTGTNGKTSTATMLTEILKAAGKRVGFIGTGLISIEDNVISEENYSMTTPDPDKLYAILRAISDSGCEYAVMEVSSHSLALKKTAPIRFYRGIFTNLSDEHLDFHKSTENYFAAKSSLFEQCDIGIFNIDDRYGQKLYKSAPCKKISCGIIENAECSASNIEMNGLCGSNYIFRGANFTSRVALKLPGAFNIYNSLLAFCCCVSMGIKPCVAKAALSNISEINGRFNIIKDRITVIIDYAHTSCATEECLRLISATKKHEDKLIAVFGCGGERDRKKRPKMAMVSQKYADKIIITSDNVRNEDPKKITDDIISGFDGDADYEIIENREEAITSAILNADDGDIVVILGKGPEKYNITQKGYEKFDEKQIVRNALNRRRAAIPCE